MDSRHCTGASRDSGMAMGNQAPFHQLVYSAADPFRREVLQASSSICVQNPTIEKQQTPAFPGPSASERVGLKDDAEKEEEEEEKLEPVKEMIYKLAAMQPVEIDPATIQKPKRRNVRISHEPQSVAARHRREKISERMRILQRLVPGGTTMDTATMLDEAIRYVKFLKKTVQELQSNHGSNLLQVGQEIAVPPVGGSRNVLCDCSMEELNRDEAALRADQVFANSPAATLIDVIQRVGSSINKQMLHPECRTASIGVSVLTCHSQALSVVETSGLHVPYLNIKYLKLEMGGIVPCRRAAVSVGHLKTVQVFQVLGNSTTRGWKYSEDSKLYLLGMNEKPMSLMKSLLAKSVILFFEVVVITRISETDNFNFVKELVQRPYSLPRASQLAEVSFFICCL